MVGTLGQPCQQIDMLVRQETMENSQRLSPRCKLASPQ